MCWDLPFRWNPGTNWVLQPGLDASAGWLDEQSLGAVMLTMGPTLAIRREGWPISFDGGISPTYISRSEFETKNLGINFQLTSRFGINLDVLPFVRIGYRYQHMSNAALSHHNPGLNLHILAISYRF